MCVFTIHQFCRQTHRQHMIEKYSAIRTYRLHGPTSQGDNELVTYLTNNTLNSWTNPHVLYTLQTLTCCQFLVFALPFPPMTLVLQPRQSGTLSYLAFVTLSLPILSVAFLKLTASRRPPAPPSGSPKGLRFGHRLALCTLDSFTVTFLHAVDCGQIVPIRRVE